jgi:hypothetical protein
MLLAGVVFKYGYVDITARKSSIEEQVAVKKALLQKYDSLITERPELEKNLAYLIDRRKKLNSRLFTGATPTLAAAALQGIVKEAVTRAGGIITSEEVRKPENYQKFKEISVGVFAILPDVRKLAELLYALETRMPYLVVKMCEAQAKNKDNPREIVIKLRVAALAGSA